MHRARRTGGRVRFAGDVRFAVRCIAVLGAAAAAATGCAADAGRIDTVAAAAARATPSDGAVTLFIEGDGTIERLESAAAVDDLPAPVLDAARARFGAAAVLGGRRVTGGGGDAWIVRLRTGSRMVEVAMDDRGAVARVARELSRDEVPADVLRAADAAVQGGVFRGAEAVQRESGDDDDGDAPADLVYVVRKNRGGATYAATIDPAGALISLRRELPATVSLPAAAPP